MKLFAQQRCVNMFKVLPNNNSACIYETFCNVKFYIYTHVHTIMYSQAESKITEIINTNTTAVSTFSYRSNCKFVIIIN